MDKLIKFIEIPVVNLERASDFYKAIFGLSLNYMELRNAKLALFCIPGDQTNGALVQGAGYQPSKNGTLIYMDGGEDMVSLISRIPKFGGKVTMDRSSLDDHGFVARFIDTEGNKIGIHSNV